ncbi:MAG: hypothetical protein PHV02_10530 [Rhodocyclaceae bacterium]|nr:hypothetical protein [Rhodocyclaceae bacterium]
MQTTTNIPSEANSLIVELRGEVEGLKAKCALLSASLNQADKEIDKLRHTVTDSEVLATTKKAIAALDDCAGAATCYHQWDFAIFEAIGKMAGHPDDIEKALPVQDRITISRLAEIARYLLDEAATSAEAFREQAELLTKEADSCHKSQ